MKNKKGFTMVELLATFVIVAILALVAIPVYNGVISWSRDNTCNAHITKVHTAVETFVDECMGNNYKCVTGETLNSYTVMKKPVTYELLKTHKYIDTLKDPLNDSLLKPSITLEREKDSEGYTDNYSITIEMDCAGKEYKLIDGETAEDYPKDIPTSSDTSDDPNQQTNQGSQEIDPDAVNEVCQLFGNCSNLNLEDITWNIDFETARSYTYPLENVTWYTSFPETGESMYVVASPLIVKDYKIGYVQTQDPLTYNRLDGCSYQYSSISGQYHGSCIIKPDNFDHEGNLPKFNIVQNDNNVYKPVLKENVDLNGSLRKIDNKPPTIIETGTTNTDKTIHTWNIVLHDGDGKENPDKFVGSGIRSYSIYRKGVEKAIKRVTFTDRKKYLDEIEFQTIVRDAEYVLNVTDNIGYNNSTLLTAPTSSDFGKPAKIGIDFKCGNSIVKDSDWHKCTKKTSFQVYVKERKEYAKFGTVPEKLNIKVEDQAGKYVLNNVDIKKTNDSPNEENGYYKYKYESKTLLESGNTSTKQYKIYVKQFKNVAELDSTTDLPTTESSNKIVSSIVNNYHKFETYKVDNTPPTCRNSGGSNEWTKLDVTITGSCSDTNGSGCQQKTISGYTYDTSGNVSKKYQNNIDSTKESPGTVYDKAGNSTACLPDRTVKIDKTAPTCGTWRGEGSSSSWAKSRTISVGCSDTGGSNCTQTTFSSSSIAGTQTTQSVSIEIKDVADNRTTCTKTANIYTDNTAPTCGTWRGEGSSSSWAKTRTISVGCSDSHSGCSPTSYSQDFANNITTQNVSFTIKDKVGNTNTCSKTANIYTDNTAPTCGTWRGEGSSSSWAKTRTISVGCSDTGGSNCTQTTFSSSSIAGTQTTKSVSIEIRDKAGNTNTCSKTANVYTDNTAPTCGTWSGEGSSSNWAQSRTISVGCSDSHSGCSPTSYSQDFANNITTQNVSFTIKDKVGNTRTCSKTANVYTDNTAPTCGTWSGEGSSTNWAKSRIISVGCSDTGGSNCTQTTFSSSSIAGTQTTKSVSIEIRDKAGNTNTCSKTANVYTDNTAPTCGTWSGEGSSSNWAQSRTISVGCSDSHSGCSPTSYSQAFRGTISTQSVSFTISDSAGNTRTCSKTADIYTDNTNPTCSVATGFFEFLGSIVGFNTVNASDGNSGIKEICANSNCVSENSHTFGLSWGSSFTVEDNAGNFGSCSR